jgi:hypothetical protein
VTPDERIAVAMILALPDGPWDFSTGCKTAADYFDAIKAASEYHVACRKYLPVIYTLDNRKPKPKREPRPDERLIK